MEIAAQGSGSASSSRALQADTRLLRQILAARKSSSSKGEDAEDELKQVWETLASPQIVSCQSTAHLLATLVEAGILDLSQTVTQLLASLGHGVSYHGIVPALGKILALQIGASAKKNGGTYACPYAISNSQHPFVSVLRSAPSSWGLVLDQCLWLLDSDDEVNVLAFLRPVLLYLFCDPNYHAHFGAMRAALFDRLLEGCDGRLANSSCFSCLQQLITWQQLENRVSLPEMAAYVVKFFNFLLEKDKSGEPVDSLLRKWRPLLACLTHRLAVQGQDPSRAVRLLAHCLHRKLRHAADSLETSCDEQRRVADIIKTSAGDKQSRLAEQPDNWDVELVVLSQMLEATAHVHHRAVVELAVKLVQYQLTTQLPTGMFVAACLPALAFESSLCPATARAKAALVQAYYARDWTAVNLLLPSSTSGQFLFDELASGAAATVRAAHILASSEKKLRSNWLSKMAESGHKNLAQFLPLFASLFLSANCSAEVKLCLELMMASVKQQDHSAHGHHSHLVYTLLLHKLANLTSSSSSLDPTVQLALLQALPALAADRICVSQLLRLVGSLSAKPSMLSLRLSLLAQMWRAEPRCFQFLHKALEESLPESVFSEVQITRASVIKGIVGTHASQYGSDLLPLLSTILNQCTGTEVILAATLALESILVLIQESVIDIRSTIKVLAPKLTRDTRPEVLVRYCRLLALAPTFRVSGPEFTAFLNDSLAWLWRVADGGDQAAVVMAAAYSAIAAFPLEATKLKMLPAAARSGIRLPPKYCATPAEAARRPEDVLPYVPCECWPRLLTAAAVCRSSAERAVVRVGALSLLSSLVRQELDNLPRSVYHLSQAMQNAGAEPVNYNHLPDHSVLRGLLGHLLQQRDLPRCEDTTATHGSVAAVLGLLAAAASGCKHLPPFDWSNLEPLIEANGELAVSFATIIARQAPHSRSALLIMERHLSAAASAAADSALTTAYCCNLEQVVRATALPPTTLGAFLNAALQQALRQAVEPTGDYSTAFRPMLAAIKSVLRAKDVSENSLMVVANAVEALFDLVPTDSGVLEEFLCVASLLPSKHLERLSSPSVWWEVTPIKLFRAANLRSQLALSEDTETPLTWLNEVLEASVKLSGDCSFLLRSLATVMTRSRTKDSQMNTSWLLELMGQLSSLLRKAAPGQEVDKGFCFLMDAFCVAVIVYTDIDSLCIPRNQLCASRASRTALLPLALSQLGREQAALACQLANWSLLLARRPDLPHGIGTLFRDCLQVFKHSASWPEATMWGRLVLA